MAGYSKWSKVKYIEGPPGVKRGQVFIKLAREIVIVACPGGDDPSCNPRLRSMTDTVRVQNLPKDNVERVIEKGTGESEGISAKKRVMQAATPLS